MTSKWDESWDEFNKLIREWDGPPDFSQAFLGALPPDASHVEMRHRIAPPAGAKAFEVEVAFLRNVLRLYRAYDEMETSEKRSFLWMLGGWHEHRAKVLFHHGRRAFNLDWSQQVQTRFSAGEYPYKAIGDNITSLIADMLAEKAGLEVRPSVASRLGQFEEWIRVLDGVEEEPTIRR